MGSGHSSTQVMSGIVGFVGVVVGTVGAVGMIGPVPPPPPPPPPPPLEVWSSGIFSITAMASCQAVSTLSACSCDFVSRASAHEL